MVEDLELKDLGRFVGTQQYHSMGALFGNAVATDGVAYVMDNGYSWFVTDALAAIQSIPTLRKEPFLVIRLHLTNTGECDMVIDDGNGNELFRQHYVATTAKRELKLYFTDNVMLLPSEY